MPKPAAKSDDDFWNSLGAPQGEDGQAAAPQPTAAAAPTPTAPKATNDDPFWGSLGSGKEAPTSIPTTSAEDPNRIHFDPDRARIVYNSVLRGLHAGLDVPAEAAAGAFDWAAGKLGYTTHQQEQTRAADLAFTQPYDVNPENQGLGPAAGRLGGELLPTLVPAAKAADVATTVARYGTNALAKLSSAAEPYVAAALRYVPSLAGGTTAGATSAAQTGQDVGQGAAWGGAVSAAVPIAADTANALLASKNPAVITAVTEHGIPLRVGQVSDKKWVRYLDDITAPESSNAAQRTAVTVDAARSMGVTPEIAAANNLPPGQITPQTMAFAKKLNGGVMNDVEKATTIEKQPVVDLVTKLRNIATDASKTPSAFDDVKAHIKDVVDSIQANGGVLPGKVYGDLVAHGTPLDVATREGNSVVREYAGQIKEALQDAMQASASPENAARYAQARLQYKNMMTLAPLVNKGIPGEISPLLLQGAANRSFKDNAFRGAGQLGSLGDVSQQFLKAPPQSGTEPREFVRGVLKGEPLNVLRSGYSKVVGKGLQTFLGRNPVTPFGVPDTNALNRQIVAAELARQQAQNPLFMTPP